MQSFVASEKRLDKPDLPKIISTWFYFLLTHGIKIRLSLEDFLKIEAKHAFQFAYLFFFFTCFLLSMVFPIFVDSQHYVSLFHVSPNSGI